MLGHWLVGGPFWPCSSLVSQQGSGPGLHGGPPAAPQPPGLTLSLAMASWPPGNGDLLGQWRAAMAVTVPPGGPVGIHFRSLPSPRELCLSHPPIVPTAPGLAQPIYIEASSSRVAEGQTLDLNCVVPGQAHAQVTWYKRGGSLPAQHQVQGPGWGGSRQAGFDLQLPSTPKSHANPGQCGGPRGENTFGGKSSSAWESRHPVFFLALLLSCFLSQFPPL